MDRRTVLKLGANLGVFGVVGLAGCAGDGGGDQTTAGGSTTTGMDSDGDTTTTTEASEGLPRGGTFVMGAQQGVQTMSPFQGFLADYLMAEAMYDRLTRVNQNFELEPNLARDWEANDDFSVWTFNLREGVTFANTDGETLTADDVKATYDYLTSEQFSGSASSLGGVESVTVVDDMTVEISLEDTDIDFPKRISETGGAFVIAPQSVLEDDPSQLEDTDYGTGAVTLTSWEQKNRIELEANPDYHLNGVDGEPLPYFDRLVWDISEDEIQRVNALSDGSIDAVSRLSPQVTNRLGEDSTVKTRTSGLQYPIVLNTTVEPFDNPKVRKAVKYALDREEIVAAISGEAQLGHHSGITPIHTYYNEELPVGDTFGTTAQPDQARQMLSEAGYEGGVEVKTFHYDDGVPQKSIIAQLFQQQMSQIGIEFEINQLTEETWLSDYWNTKGEWYITNYSTRVLGETVLKLALRSDGPWNEANWSNEEFDQAFQNAVTATDRETKAENLKKCQRINHRQGAWVGTYHPNLYGAHRNYVQNYRLYPTYIKDFVTQCAVDK